MIRFWRSRRLKAALRRSLTEATTTQALDPKARLLWLQDQLENYLDRWRAFVSLENEPTPFNRNDDLFLMLVAGSEVYAEEHGSWPGRSDEAWRQFQALLKKARQTGDRSLAQPLRTAMTELRSNPYTPQAKRSKKKSSAG